MKNECNRTIEYVDGIKYRYYRCDKNVFVRVSYNDVRGRITECLCKKHYNAFIKNTNRIKGKSGFDFEIETEFLTPPLPQIKQPNTKLIK